MGRVGQTVLSLLALMVLTIGTATAGSEFSGMWYSKKSSIVLDAYEYTPIDWTELKKNERLVGFVNKASDGLPPTVSCKGSDKYCRLAWRRYSIAKELYHTRKNLAKSMGLKWGAYHLARPGNPIRQALHFLSFAKPDKDDLIALDIEENDPSKWMSLKDAEVFAKVIYRRLRRYPMLYTNHSTAKYIARNRDKYPVLARMNLWYARYRADIRGVFPMGNWRSYTMWQFSAQANCNKRRCLRRIRGVDHRIDVNVLAMPPQEARSAWPFAKLTARKLQPVPKPSPAPQSLPVVEANIGTGEVVSAFIGHSLATDLLDEAGGSLFQTRLTTSTTPSLTTSQVAGMPVAVPSWRPGTMVTVVTVRRAVQTEQTRF